MTDTPACRPIPLSRRCFAEAFGTFAMVFAGTGAMVIDSITGGGVSHAGVAITFGLIVLAMIHAVGDVSGAHLNPAVSLAFWAAGRFSGRAVIPYVLSQSAGAVAASLCLRLMFGNVGALGATLPHGSAGQSFALEVILTAILMFVILGVCVGAKEKGIGAGIAVSGVVALEAMFAGPISGASMNPVRSFAPALVSGNWTHLWVYLVAPILGALAAIPCWTLTRGPQGGS